MKKDASVVDPWWSIAFLLVTVSTAVQSGHAGDIFFISSANALLITIVAVWAIRLWWHLLRRARGKPEDPRYTAFRKRFGPERYWWVSFFQVFVLQGVLVLLVTAPLQLSAATQAPLGIGHIAGAALFAFGFSFEAVADAQLQRFRDDPKRADVLDTGLWRYSRHPNYFGEVLLGWGFWLCALDSPWGWATVLSPILMTFLLLRVSGVTMLDSHMKKTRPAYADYIRRTSSFIPRPPRP
jgi:steroid 5-alpha reductase family enzyme